MLAWIATGALMLGGCASSSPKPSGKLHVQPMVQGDVVALDADDIVQVMRIAGFHDADILEAGPALRNALASSGGAFLRLDSRVEAIFAMDGRYLHISSRSRGSFSYVLSDEAEDAAGGS